MNPVRDDNVTTTCEVCGQGYVPSGRKRYCSAACRTAAWRRRLDAPSPPPKTPAKSEVIYECPSCETRYLGEQRCDDCNQWCRRIGPGGSCPHCDEPVAISDLITPEQFTTQPLPSNKQPT